jgi:hypothetical protein
VLKEKRKNKSLTNVDTLAFILLWSASYAIGFGVLWLTLEKLREDPYHLAQMLRYWDLNTLFLLFGLGIPGLLQMLLVKRFLQGSLRAWINLTGVGIIIAWVILHLTRVLILEPRGVKTMQLEFLIPALFTPVALAQTIWLAQRVKRAWLWPLVSLFGTFIFIAILTVSMDLSGIVFGAIVYGLLMGIALFYLHIDILWYTESF